MTTNSTPPRKAMPPATVISGAPGANKKAGKLKSKFIINRTSTAESQDDRKWFKRNPHRNVMARAITAHESATLCGGDTNAVVIVYQDRPGVRYRQPVKPYGTDAAGLLAILRDMESKFGAAFLESYLMAVLSTSDEAPVMLRDYYARAILRDFPAGGTA